MGRLADRPMAKARLRRRAYPIRAYVGPNGTGKSALMVYDALPSLDAGRPVLSTVRLLDYRNPRPCPIEDPRRCDDPVGHMRGHLAAHPQYVRWTDLQQLVDWRDGDVLADEITGLMNSRESQSMPAEIANYLVQMRRRNVTFSFSTPAWGRADIIVREVCQGVTLMSASLPKRARQVEGEAPRLWFERRLFCARTYDPTYMDEFEAHRADGIKPEVTAFYWGPGSAMFSAYDTYDQVLALLGVTDTGRCLRCTGKRQPRKCVCGTDHGPAAQAEGSAATPPQPAAPRQRRPRQVPAT